MLGLYLLSRADFRRWFFLSPPGWCLIGAVVLVAASGFVEHWAEVTGMEKRHPHVFRYPEELLEVLAAGLCLVSVLETEAAAPSRAPPPTPSR